MVLRNKYGSQQIVLLPEVISDHNLMTLPLPYQQSGQNVLLNDRSLRTFASLNAKYGGSLIRVFTVLTFFERTYFNYILKKDQEK